MMLLRSDLMTENKQNSNAGNGGDLLKHSAYLALLDELVSREPWHHEIHIVEAHSGKGVYAATSSHLREARQLPDYAASRLGIAQTAAFADPPLGFGAIAGIRDGELPYAGSPVLHAREIMAIPRRTLTLMDRDSAVGKTVACVFSQPSLAVLAPDLRLVDPGGTSEQKVLSALEESAYLPTSVLHFDPFAFVMSAEDAGIRNDYVKLITQCDELVGRGKLAAATLFITWGSNSHAALEDLDGAGYEGGLKGGYNDLLKTVDAARRIVFTWCWELYFALILIVHQALRSQVAARLQRYVQPFAARIKKRLTIQ